MILTEFRDFSDAEFEDEAHHMPPLQPAPVPPPPEKNKEKDDNEPVKIAPKPMTLPQPKVIPNNLQIPIQTGIRTANGTAPTIPFPLLILNGLPNATNAQNQIQNTKRDGQGNGFNPGLNIPDTCSILKDLLDVQKENLEVEKQRLELEKQKLEFERLVGSQLMTLLPMFGGLLQRLAFPNPVDATCSDGDHPKKNGRKRPSSDSGLDVLKDSKILRNVLERGIKKYMLGEDNDDNESDNEEDSGIQNDENSNASSK